MSLAKLIFDTVTGGVFDAAKSIVHDYVNGKISAEEAKARIAEAQAQAEADTEKAWADATANAYESAQATIRNSVIMQRAVAAVCVLELSVLIFYQIGVPTLALYGVTWPSAGVDMSWAYALVAGTAGMVVLRR